MPNFSTTYANQCGVKLSQNPPDFPSSFVILPDQKYITLHCGAGHPARIYDFYSEVCALLLKPLKDNNIIIVQIGSENEIKADFTLDYRGKTTLKQCSFLIENSLLHFGNDSCWAHLAGLKGKPLINLCPNSPASVVSPHYHGKIFSFESIREGKFTYEPNEFPKSINTIKPELIAKKVLEFLGIEDNIKISTVRIGEAYNQERVIDFIPDFYIKPNILQGNLNCRADIKNDPKVINHFFNFYKGVLIMDNPISLELIKALKKNIVKLVYKLDKVYDVNYLEKLSSIGISYILSYSGTDEGLNKARLDCFDLNPVWKQSPILKPVCENLDENTLFKTKRTIISDFKQYPSKAHFKNKHNFNGESLKLKDYLDNEIFWENLEHYYLFNNA